MQTIEYIATPKKKISLRGLAHTLVLLSLIVAAFVGWAMFGPSTVVEGFGTETISAEAIQQILELNTASQEVAVTTDTTYMGTGYAVNLMGLELFPTKTVNRLVERRVFVLKAGTSDFQIVGEELFVKMPSITSIEEMPNLRSVSVEEGSWSAIGQQSIAIKAKNSAKVAALQAGIIEAAQLALEAEFTRMNIRVVWQE